MTGPKVQSERTINTIRGKNLVGRADKEDVDTLLEHIDALESFLDDGDDEDTFGTEGWRHVLGLD